MVSARSHRVSRVPWYSGSCRVSSGFGYGALTLSGRLFQSRSPAVTESLMQSEPRDARITVWALPRSLAATYGIDVSFSSSGYLDVSVPRVPLYKLCIYLYISMVFMDGFPHSDIGGSQNICFSPPLFAAYHVLLRLPVPRHPPCALFCLTISTYSVMSDGLFNLSIALVCFCYSLKNNRFDVLIFHQFIFSMQFSRNNSLVSRPVEITRFELVTPCLQGRCSPN